MTADGYADDGIYAYDREKTVRAVTDVLQANPEAHGFVVEDRIARRFEDGGIKYLRCGGDIVAVIEFNHPSKLDHTRIYNVACYDEHVGDGLRDTLVHRVMKESPYGRAITKVPVDVSQNDFWHRHAAETWRESGRDRALNVYRIVADVSRGEGMNVLQDYE